MKKYLFFVLIFILSSCGSAKFYQTYLLSPGMTKNEVLQVLGPPAKSDFDRNVEEWHYCKTGMASDQFVALYFYEGKLVTKTNYTVTSADVDGAFGNCDMFIKMGNYKTPDVIIEIRNR